MKEKNCIHCDNYVDCRNRQNRMRKVKSNHGTNSREDVRLRIAMMQHIAEQCAHFSEGV